MKTCCSVYRGVEDIPQTSISPSVPGPDISFFNPVSISTNWALVGTNDKLLPQDGETPLRKVKVNAFQVMATSVTNAMFDQFVKATGYVTQAERLGWSFVFFAQLVSGAPDTQAVADAPWWRKVEGACWRQISGPSSIVDWLPDHPVVHVSWYDAIAFAKWATGRLPSEVEWEHAARGGLGDVRYPWGDKEPDDILFQPCNIWQGKFPKHNLELDNFAATAPAKSFDPNGYGLYNVVGNVWEWTADPFTMHSMARSALSRQTQMRGAKILKGGSFLCHSSYCYRYRIAARIGNAPDTTTSNVGFRLVF
ncbi:formylglycine-generating enzyme family protein [Brucella cytisi]|uniref:formylglycine-generating enzyme family protein n=1 Tax=Brucella cytisi TaxID=407152 RepID=UPI0035D7220D